MAAKEVSNEDYLESKVKSIVEPMLLQLATAQPDDPVDFMIKWIKKNYGDRPSQNRNKRFELEFLRSEVDKLEGKVQGAGQT